MEGSGGECGRVSPELTVLIKDPSTAMRARSPLTFTSSSHIAVAERPETLSSIPLLWLTYFEDSACTRHNRDSQTHGWGIEMR